MVTIKTIAIANHFTIDNLYISFIINDTYEDLANYIFNLYRSYNPEQNYELVSADIKTFDYTDYTVNLIYPSLTYYYKVEVVDRNNPANKVMSTIYGEYKTKPFDNEAIALTEIYKTYLDNVIGNEPMYLLKRRHGGQICSCYDEVRNRSDSLDCKLCYGTKYTGGYFDPVKIKVCRINPPALQKVFNIGEDGEDTTPVQLWTSYLPVIQNDDILVNVDNERFIIGGVQPSYKNDRIIRQSFQIYKLPKSNIAYQILIREG